MVECHYKAHASMERLVRVGGALDPEVNRTDALLLVESGFLPAGLTSEKTKLTFIPAEPTLATAGRFAE